jgi:hypothetical protein
MDGQVKLEKKSDVTYLGEVEMSTSFSNTEGLSMEAMHPIIPDIECPM